MLKTLFVLSILLVSLLVLSIHAQSPENVSFKVTVVDKDLNVRNVPKFGLVIRKPGDISFPEAKITTSSEGVASLSLRPGSYLVTSDSPLLFQNRTYDWEIPFAVELGKVITVDVSSHNTKIRPTSTSQSSQASTSNRDVSRGGEMFRVLRDGVVTVQGELEPGTGFIIDELGLVLTNQHVIDQSNEIRVRFDKDTAVKARVLAVDEQRDLAVLQINMSAFPERRVLAFAASTSVEKPVIEGERIFTIGSPLHQDKILSSGTVSKIEKGAIITDIAFNSFNAGAPLFNSLGQVV